MSKGTLRRGGAKKAFFVNGKTRGDRTEIIGKWVNGSIGESGDGKWETGDGRREMGDGRRETGDERWETGDERRETGDGSRLRFRTYINLCVLCGSVVRAGTVDG